MKLAPPPPWQRTRRRRQLIVHIRSLSCSFLTEEKRPLHLNAFTQQRNPSSGELISSVFPSRLQELTLVGYFLERSAMVAIAQFVELERLELSTCTFRYSDGLLSLLPLEKLKTLRLPHNCSRWAIEGEVRHVVAPLSVTDLGLGFSSSFTDYCWLTQLERLSLQYATVTIETVASLPMLRQLRLCDCVWGEDPDEVFPHLQKLEVLHVSARIYSCSMLGSDDVLRHIGQLTQLRDLCLSEYRSYFVTAAGLWHLTGLTQVQFLEVSGGLLHRCLDVNVNVTILRELTGLRTLRVNQCVMDELVTQLICSAVQLHVLILHGCDVTTCGEFFDQLVELSELRRLQLLEVMNCPGDAELAKLAHMRSLSSVELELSQHASSCGALAYTNDIVDFLLSAGICLSPRSTRKRSRIVQARRILRACGLHWLEPCQPRHTTRNDRCAPVSPWLVDALRCVWAMIKDSALQHFVCTLSVALWLCYSMYPSSSA
ncbi:Hypothetical protein, putative [Bodo saltans]|uniref:Uncharacterized protein n=1 Tax=Bodo saltans TaxID=75058 RepID=A0A0S4JG53_BODSA|nr:Hypothetical protein, putative [Bodo saltans]|eukprot:CUG89294.1 Hypothetical protein, putative [Bodo saltans]